MDCNTNKIERFLIEFPKTKTKAITLTNHKGQRQSNEPITTRSKYTKSKRSAGKRVRASQDCFGLTSDGFRKWREIFCQTLSRVNQKQGKAKASFFRYSSENCSKRKPQNNNGRTTKHSRRHVTPNRS